MRRFYLHENTNCLINHQRAQQRPARMNIRSTLRHLPHNNPTNYKKVKPVGLTDFDKRLPPAGIYLSRNEYLEFC